MYRLLLDFCSSYSFGWLRPRRGPQQPGGSGVGSVGRLGRLPAAYFTQPSVTHSTRLKSAAWLRPAFIGLSGAARFGRRHRTAAPGESLYSRLGCLAGYSSPLPCPSIGPGVQGKAFWQFSPQGRSSPVSGKSCPALSLHPIPITMTANQFDRKSIRLLGFRYLNSGTWVPANRPE